MSIGLSRTPHVLGHCGLCGLMIYCGTCNNNMCNGGRGQNGKCPDCDSAAELLQRGFAAPMVYKEVRATREEIRAWLMRQLKRIPQMAGSEDPEWALEQVLEAANCAFDSLVELERALRVQDEPEPTIEELEDEYKELCERPEVAAAIERREREKAVLRWFSDHALLVQLIANAQNDADRLTLAKAIQSWTKANPRPFEEEFL